MDLLATLARPPTSTADSWCTEATQSAVINGWLAEYMIDRNFAVETDSGYAACSMAADGVSVAFVDDLSVPANSA